MNVSPRRVPVQRSSSGMVTLMARAVTSASVSLFTAPWCPPGGRLLFIALDGVAEAPDKWHFEYFNDEMGAAVGEMMGGVLHLVYGPADCTTTGPREK